MNTNQHKYRVHYWDGGKYPLYNVVIARSHFEACLLAFPDLRGRISDASDLRGAVRQHRWAIRDGCTTRWVGLQYGGIIAESIQMRD